MFINRLNILFNPLHLAGTWKKRYASLDESDQKEVIKRTILIGFVTLGIGALGAFRLYTDKYSIKPKDVSKGSSRDEEKVSNVASSIGIAPIEKNPAEIIENFIAEKSDKWVDYPPTDDEVLDFLAEFNDKLKSIKNWEDINIQIDIYLDDPPLLKDALQLIRFSLLKKYQPMDIRAFNSMIKTVDKLALTDTFILAARRYLNSITGNNDEVNLRFLLANRLYFLITENNFKGRSLKEFVKDIYMPFKDKKLLFIWDHDSNKQITSLELSNRIQNLENLT